jgi:hypothetical protein
MKAKKTSFRYPPKDVSHCKLLADKVYRKLASEKVNVFAKTIRKSAHFSKVMMKFLNWKKINRDLTISKIPRIIQDPMNIKWIRILSPVSLGLRRGGKEPQGLVTFSYIGKKKDGPKQETNINFWKSLPYLPVLKRELILLRDEWSRTDAIEDVYTIMNDCGTPLEKLKIRTEFFRDELEIFDVEGRKLYFESCKEKADELDSSTLGYSPYSFLVSLHSPLQGNEKTALKLRYKVISDKPSELFQIGRGIKDAIPFVMNESYFYRFFEIDRIFGRVQREFTFTMKLGEGTTATSYVILGIKESDPVGDHATNDLIVKTFDSDTQNDGEDETNYYAEGNEVFFAFSKKKLEKLKYLIVFLRISPQKRSFLAISSIQLLTVSVLVSLALVIHSLPFRDSFSLITGLFLASLTLLLYPERSRVMDTRISVSFYSGFLSIMIILHVTSIYGKFEVVSSILNDFPMLNQFFMPAGLILLGGYIVYVFLEWAHRRDCSHRLLRRFCKEANRLIENRGR